VLTAHHEPDWAKIAVYGVNGIVSGHVTKSRGKLQLEVLVAVSAQQPPWSTTVALDKLGGSAESKLVAAILEHLEGAVPSPPIPEATAPPVPVLPQPPLETPEDREAKAAAADAAFAANAKVAPKPAPAPAKLPEPAHAAPKPPLAQKPAEPDEPPAQRAAAGARGPYKPLPPELLGFTPRI
jgi:hypothetical protein